MKDKSKKHDHKGTKLLKLSIFFTIMLAPILAIAFKCAYVTFNKNAYQSYTEYQTQVENKVTLSNFTDVINNVEYILDTSNCDFTQQLNSASYFIEFSNADWETPQSAKYFTIGGSVGYSTQFAFTYYDANKQYISRTPLTTADTYKFVLISASTTNTTYYPNNLHGATLNTWELSYIQGKLDNAFYYAIDEMQESTLFNWTENTAIYTPIQAMTSGLGITTDAIAILLTYWMYITLIYIVFDIVIELFTYLTHTLMGQPM